jgi:two-component system, chemotaxis family, protein-glutamate methylesterase/glutaminase
MTKKLVRVLVVDDSAYIRKVFSELLEQNPHIEVVGTARDGQDALEKTAELNPDVIVLDVFMPVMDAVEFMQVQMQRKRLPVVVVSSAGEDEETVLAALDAGALEFIQKPTPKATSRVYHMGDELVDKVLAVAGIPPEKLAIAPDLGQRNAQMRHPFQTQGRVQAVVIGLSTGGPRALRQLIPLLPTNFPIPLAVVLHMPAGFTNSYAARLNEVSNVEVLEASEGLDMSPGRVILAKAGYHLKLEERTGGVVSCHLFINSPETNSYCPSADVLFKSAAAVYGSQTLGVVMTGMGNDGLEGAAWIKAAGGLIFTEAEESSIVYGMPRAVYEAGLSDKIVPLENMADKILRTI